MSGSMVISEKVQTKLFAFEEALIADHTLKSVSIDMRFLEEKYNLSKGNAQLILDCAFRKGLLEKTGSGCFMRKPPEKPRITSVFQHAAKSGLKPKSIVRSVELVQSTNSIAEKLRISKGALIYQQKRSRLIENHVVANQCNSIPFCVSPGLETLDLENQSFQVMLETKFHAVVNVIQEDYNLADPTAEDRLVLDLQENSKVVVVHRLSLSATNMPIVWADIHVNPVHFHLVEKLWPEGAQLLASLDKKGAS